MKYILAFSLLLVATLTQAQSPAVPQATIVVSSLSELTDYTGSLLQANWTDTARGGKFNLVDATGLTVDDGVVFASGKAGKYWKRDFSQAEGYHTRWYGALGGLSNNTVLLQRAINAARGYLLNFDDSVYHVRGALDLQSHSKYNFNTRIVQDSTGDVNMITALKDTDFVLLGVLRLDASNPGSNCLSDGVFFDSCSDFSIDHIICNGTRFGVQFGHSKNAKVNIVEGYNLKGFQVVAASGGSVFTIYASSDIFVNYVYGENIWKAGVYFSLTGEGVVNERIKINAINLKMDTGSNLANGVGFRSARNVDIGSIQVDGGMAGVYAQLNFEGQSVEDVHIGNLRVTNITQVTNVANALKLSSVITERVRRISVDNLDMYNGVAPGIFVLHGQDIHIGNAVIDSIAGDRGVSLDDVKNLKIDKITVKRTQDAILINDTIDNFQIGHLYFENLTASSDGIVVNTNPSFLGVLKNFSAGSITGYNDPGRAPFAYVFDYGAPPNSETLNIGQIKYTNGGGVLWRGKVFTNISGKILWAGIPPASTSYRWNYGDIIYNDSSLNQSAQGWRCYGGGAPGDWRRLDKAWGLDSVLATGASNTSRTMTFENQTLLFENPLGSASNKGIAFSEDRVSRYFLYRNIINGSLILNQYAYNGSLLKLEMQIDSLTGNIGLFGIALPQQPLHVGGNIRGDAFMGLNTAGSYLQLAGQSASPASSSGMVMWADASHNLSWRNQGNTFIKKFLHTNITADRDYTLPDASGTLLLNSNTAAVTNKDLTSGTNTFPSITIDNTATALGGSIDTRPRTVSTASDQTSTITGYTNITGLTYSCAAGVKYHAVVMLYTECSTANGLKVAISLSGSGATLQSGAVVGNSTSVVLSRWARPTISGATIGTFNQFISTAPSGGMVRMEFFFTTVNTGTLNIQFSAVTGGDVATIDAGSTMLVEQTQ